MSSEQRPPGKEELAPVPEPERFRRLEELQEELPDEEIGDEELPGEDVNEQED